jgi:hypothetical protein
MAPFASAKIRRCRLLGQRARVDLGISRATPTRRSPAELGDDLAGDSRARLTRCCRSHGVRCSANWPLYTA